VRRVIRYVAPDGREYRPAEETATLMVRPHGLHLSEPRMLVDGRPVAGALFDFGLFVFHNARELLRRGSGPYLYLPKLESYHEARFWNQVCKAAEGRLDLPRAPSASPSSSSTSWQPSRWRRSCMSCGSGSRR